MPVISDPIFSQYNSSSDEEYLPSQFISEGEESSSESEDALLQQESEDGYVLRSRVRLASDARVFQQQQPPKKRARTAASSEKVAVINPDSIIGRDQEARLMLRMLAQPTPQNPILIGPPGIGKRSIVQKLTGMLQQDSCPEHLRGSEIAQIDCKELLGKAEGADDGRYFLDVIQKIKRKHLNPIFFFHDIDDLATADGAMRFIFQSFLQKTTYVIGTISDTETGEKAQQTIGTLRRYHFHQIAVEESSKEETEEIVKRKVTENPLPSKIRATPESIRMAVNLSGRYDKQRPYPVKAINLMFETATDAWMRGCKTVKEDDVARMMAGKLKMPAEQLMTSDTTYLNKLYHAIREQIVGQDEAVDIVFQGIKRGKLGFRDRSKPWGVYLFVGPTGVGKTELAKTVARELNGHFIRYDMGEYQESHSLARLIGSPPGYVGYEEGGGMTNELRKHPHSIVLFDEMEKAHPDVANTLLQVFDDGRLTDGQGHTVDCTEAIFIMTSNLGSKTLFNGSKKPMKTEDVLEQMYPLIEEKWSPEFLGRLTAVIPFQHLSNQDYPSVIEVHLMRLAKEVAEEHAMTLRWSDEVIPYLLRKHSGDMRSGIRGLCERVKIEVFDALADAKEGGVIARNKIVALEVQHNELFVHSSMK